MSFPLLALSFVLVGGATVCAAVRTGHYFLFGLLGSTLLLALHGRVYHNYLSDDAFIYFRYARNFADGFGPTWNPGGERVEGYTGILWLLPLTAASKLGLNVPETARYLGFTASAATLAMLYPLSAALPAGRQYPLAPVLASLALAAATPFAVWSLAGMDSALFILLITIAVWLHLREDAGRPSAIPFSGVAFALAIATRPEGALFAVATGLFKLASLRDPETRKARSLQIYIWTFSILLLYGGYFVWRYWYYDYLLPNTFYAKMGADSDIYDRGMHYLAVSGRQHAVPLFAVGLLVYLVRARPRRPALYVVALTVAWMTWIVLSGGDTLVASRFIAPMLPVLYVGAALGAFQLLGPLAQAGDRLVARPALALLFLVILMGLLYGSFDSGVRVDRELHEESVVVGRWMARNLPPDTMIGVTRAGAIPYYSRLPTLDMLGLNDTHIAHADVDLGKGIAGHEKYDIDYVLERRPEILLLGRLTPEPRIYPSQYTSHPWVFPDEHFLVQDERTFFFYKPVAIQMGQTTWLSVLVDRQALGQLRTHLERNGIALQEAEESILETGAPSGTGGSEPATGELR